MILAPETQDWLDQLAAQGPAQPPATLGEAWRANWSSAGLTTIGGASAPRDQALQELRDAYSSAAGHDARDEARRRNIAIDVARPDQEAGVIELLSRGLPEPAQKRLAPMLDIDARASAIAAKTEHEAAEVNARTFGVTANAAAWLAGAARTMVDPATLAVTFGVAAVAPEALTLPGFLAREAAVNAGTTAVTQPFVNLERERLGLEPAPFVESVAESAFAGAALGGLFRARAW